MRAFFFLSLLVSGLLSGCGNNSSETAPLTDPKANISDEQRADYRKKSMEMNPMIKGMKKAKSASK